MKIACIGADGQLGTDLTRLIENLNHDYFPLTENEIDVTNLKLTRKVITGIQPDIIINTAAYHRVDECEDNPEKAFLVNTVGARNVSITCKENDCAHMFFSTDFVFDGKKKEPYTEADKPNPQSVYAISKFAGEAVVRITAPRYYIIRPCGLYGVAGSLGKGGNFVETMIKLALQGTPLRVVNDQIVTPTYTVDLAQKVLELVPTEEYGIYHMTNTGGCSWYEFAKTIFELTNLEAQVTPVSSQKWAAKAKRPSYSVLDNQHLREIGLEDMRHWKDALAAYLEERKELDKSPRLE
jgi:dTDP-4-dehydrorhamnose reductase